MSRQAQVQQLEKQESKEEVIDFSSHTYCWLTETDVLGF